MSARIRLFTLVSTAVLAAFGCDDPPVPGSSFYDERIDPLVQVGCVQQTTGCHGGGDDGVAVGNLDMSSYDALTRRRDVLPAYGPYSVGLLLLKGGEEIEVPVDTWDPDPITGERFARIETDIRHNAGLGIQLDSSGFAELKRWIDAGATRNGVPPEELADSLGSCVNGPGAAEGFDPSSDPPNGALYRRFVDDVQPVLRESCAGSRCHGSPIADLYLTCGETPEEQRWNFFVAVSHLSGPASTSPLLRRPLTQLRGGVFHEGGDVFASPDAARYQTIFTWAQEVVDSAPELLLDDDPDPGLRFFANRVQPVLVRKGCMFLGCHSPSMFHDLRLRGGAGGVFSRIATRRNHEMSLHQLALESANPNDSRIIAKNLFPASDVSGGQGVAHRGGSLFEDFGSGGTLNPADAADCAGVDADAGDLNEIPAYCVLARWHEIERETAIAAGTILPAEAPVGSLLWVARPPGVGDVRDFDTFRGGADLRAAPITMDDAGAITLGDAASVLGMCGLGAAPDVRGPAVSWDGTRVAFAARDAASAPLRLYWMAPDGTDCEPVPGVAPAMDTQNGILTHDFDPAFAPDGRLVFASTRGNVMGSFPYSGPTRTPAAMQPNANLYVLEDGDVRQLTFLLNQEVAPSFMADGRVIFSAEKREPQLHQLALRRQNLDGGDYHPLFAQRGSVGFGFASEVVELPNRNLLFVASTPGATDGGGGLVLVNRSIGPDQQGRPGGDRSYVHSMALVGRGALGAIPGVPARGRADGIFRSPARLPSGRVVVSCAFGDPPPAIDGGPVAYELCELDPHTGTMRTIGGEAGQANVDAVAVHARPQQGVFRSRIDEANGNTRITGEDDAVVHVHDFPLLATLLFANTREGRPIPEDVAGFDVFEALPPPEGTSSFAEVMGDVVMDDLGPVYVRYERRGRVPLFADGSAKFRVPGGMPLVLQVVGDEGPLTFEDVPAGITRDETLSGELIQREQMQFYPGERSNQSLQRRFFNGLCGGCHGSVTGRELDVAVDVDVLTSASRTLARDADATNVLR